MLKLYRESCSIYGREFLVKLFRHCFVHCGHECCNHYLTNAFRYQSFISKISAERNVIIKDKYNDWIISLRKKY